MQVSLNLIKQFVKEVPVSGSELALKLTMSTVEVEGVLNQAELYHGIRIGKILEIIRHPQADRLWVCRVDVRDEELQIICGGVNLKRGMTVAVAMVGSRVKWHGEGDLIELSKAKIRGIESNGMIAAANEIGLERLFPGNTEKEILDLSGYRLRVGDNLASALGLNDTILTIDNKSMTHRPDLWGHYGIAREVATLFNSKLKPLAPPSLPVLRRNRLPLTLVVRDTESCPRYEALIIDNVQVAPSPWWLKRDLEVVGIKSVNGIVDVTNYVMVFLGQPLHAFDYARVQGHKLIIDTTKSALSFEALNGKTYQAPEGSIIISDISSPVGLAGIMGGAGSAISGTTKTVVIEAANFSASAVRRTSLRIGLRTDASARFEKKLDPALVPLAIQMAGDLLLKLYPEAHIAAHMVSGEIPTAKRSIEVSKAFIDQRLGLALESKEIVDILRRLEFGVTVKKNIFTIAVPSFRERDISIPEDIVEEVARIHGYDAIPPQLPRIEMPKPERESSQRIERQLKTMLSKSFGYHEVYSYSFADHEWTEALGLGRSRVSVKNYLTKEQSYLRTSLLPQLMRHAAENARFQDAFSLFEVGRVFAKVAGEYAVDNMNQAFLPKQQRKIGGVVAVPAVQAEDAFRRVKGMLQQIGSSWNTQLAFSDAAVSFSAFAYEVKIHDKIIGSMGIVKDDLTKEDLRGTVVVWWEIALDSFSKFATHGRTYKQASRYPEVTRDMAIVVDGAVRWEDIEGIIKGSSPLLLSVGLFDVFTSGKLGINKKSLAFRLTFGSSERTLTSADAETVVQLITKKLSQSLSAEIR